MVGVININNPSADAKRLTDVLQQAHLSSHFTWWAKQQPSIDDAPVDYDLFIGPKPW
jgi:hypothetical protein